jgi:hypothetical protein
MISDTSHWDQCRLIGFSNWTSVPGRFEKPSKYLRVSVIEKTPAYRVACPTTCACYAHIAPYDLLLSFSKAVFILLIEGL